MSTIRGLLTVAPAQQSIVESRIRQDPNSLVGYILPPKSVNSLQDLAE